MNGTATSAVFLLALLGAWIGKTGISKLTGSQQALRSSMKAQNNYAVVHPHCGPAVPYICAQAHSTSADSNFPTPRDYCTEDVQPGSDIAEFPVLSEWIPCDQLERLQDNGDIVVSSSNCAFLDFAVNLVRAYKRLGRKNVLIVAEDCAAYRLLAKELGSDHVAKPLVAPTTQHATEFDTEEYGNIVRRRPLYLLGLLYAGIKPLWQDADSVPLIDLFAVLPHGLGAVDIVVMDDTISFCSCFIYLGGNPVHALWVIERWASILHEIPENNDQPALNQAMDDALDPAVFGSNNFTRLILPKRQLPSGFNFDDYHHTALWYHPNWMIGRDTKQKAFEQRGLWNVSDLHSVC
jgi:hypothetical protein